MGQLSQEQEEKRASIQKSATIIGAIVGVIVGLLLLWILSGQSSIVRFGGAIVVGAAVAFGVFKASFNSSASSAKCESCGAAFSRSRTDRAEVLKSSEPKEEREDQDDGSIKVTTWTEETYDVTDTYTCASCGDAEVKTYETTKRKDETSIVEQRKKGAAETASEDTPDPETEAPVAKGKKGGGGDSGSAKGRKGSS